MTVHITRRTMLRAGLAAGGAAVVAPLVSSCSNEGRGVGGDGSGGAAGAAVLPTYIPYEGVQPDLDGTGGVADAYLTEVTSLVKGTDTPPGDGQPISTATFISTPIPPGVSQNQFWQELNQRLGSPLEHAPSTFGDYEQKFPTMVAGDQLPDIWTVGTAPQRPALLEAKALDLTQYLAGDAIAAYPFLANIPTESWGAAVFNGKIFGIPTPRGGISTSALYARDDLLAKKGITSGPTSFEELFDICAEMTAPGSNTWALSSQPLNFVRQMLGVPNTWQLVDGRLISALEHPAQKEALEATRRLVEAGYVHPDAFASESQNYKAWFANGTTSMALDTLSAWPGFPELAAGQEEFSMTTYGPPKFDGSGQSAAWLGNPTFSITAINVKAGDRAETLLKVMNYFASPYGTEEQRFLRGGTEGVHHTITDGKLVLTDLGIAETRMGLQYIAEAPTVLKDRAQFDAQMAVIPTAVPNPAVSLYSETDSRKGGQLFVDLENLEGDILQGRRPVSDWDQGVASWKSGGGDAIRDEFQQALDTAPPR